MPTLCSLRGLLGQAKHAGFPALGAQAHLRFVVAARARRLLPQ